MTELNMLKIKKREDRAVNTLSVSHRKMFLVVHFMSLAINSGQFGKLTIYNNQEHKNDIQQLELI